MQTPSDILGEHGALAELVPDFTVRPQQVEMAEAIREAIDRRESLVCEAGTGTGKTFAYLVPALQSGYKVIISTGTRHLQDQLFARDLPLVRKAVGRPLNAALLKGRANYLCLFRMKLAETDSRRLDRQGRSYLFDIRDWSQRTDSGDLAELTHIPEDAAVRAACISTVDNCLGQECDFYDDCFVFRARRRAAEADLAVVNHHLFLADMVLKEAGYGELLPSAEVVVFDEAHQLPELASQFFSETLSGRQLLDLVADSRAAYFEEAADLPDFPELLDRCEKAVRDLRLSFPGKDNRVAWSELKDSADVSAALSTLLEKMADAHRVLEDFAARGKALDNCHKRVAVLSAFIEQFGESEQGEYVRWLELRGNGFLLHRTPLDIADVFRSRMSEYDCLSIFTSATLSVNGRFDHFSAQLGLEEVESRCWDSPFDFENQSLLYLPPGLPDPGTPGYTERVVEQALPLLRLTGGRAFFLFTSYRALHQAAEQIGEALDYPLLVQGDAPRTELLETFRTTAHAVLLGTSSFWEGVDVRGQALSCVIIDKLPFAAPDDPVLRARMKQMEEQGRNPFREYQVPEAVLALKQGIGRLLRDKSDYGVLMIGDPRVRTRNYGSTFLNSLPQMTYTRELSDIEAFFYRHEEYLGSE